ncbi:bifunctional serine/threonine-protein kinase/glutamate ABC transporter substrate-binding protein [Streptomyces sp. HB2AG]|uniref:bifunctional serine/threonine-protein kinase/glutamate ABC transporter substrate-binding protein n=1 Tax=Streptomyces sp. HB2AG TaxID=2983400 RepID=UPI0022AA593D|nr:bifunctional serine/threonine-protein kinase/glutamate ABC transporter substrate-binding protein [Streptomyces sp. HB2AG]MCZ2526967.1 bifunctional serine/threonine-protein kinase/glutamate ABC transporter substrate-binding protein [Streptomyces sp. HB2AG]
MRTGGTPGGVVDGRYTLLRPLGRGGMGVVWEALDTRLNRQVAVKELLFRGAVDPDTQAQWVRRARREAEAIARIDHEHVVAVHDVIEAEGQVWIVMEQVDPHSLADLLREHDRLPPLNVARIGLEVLRGLRAVHAAAVLHRDVKPHNILFRRDGRAVLMDFGIATFEGAAQVTRRHETVGTPQYLAPELASPWTDGPREAAPAADLWSLGVTLFEAVEGRAPFRGPTPVEVLHAVRHADLPPMRHAGPLRPLIEGLLVKDPESRTGAARAEQLLQHVAQETPLQPLPLPRPARAGDGRNDTDGGREAGTTTEVHLERTPVPSPLPAAPDAPRPPSASRRRRALLRAAAGAAGLALLAAAGWYGVERLREEAAPRLSSSPTWQAARDRGYLLVGVKEDQPGLSRLVDPATGEYEGFDVDLARAVAERLGFEEVRFETVNTKSREYRLTSGQVDLIVASYSITEERKKEVDFAGPYYLAGQDFLVREDTDGIDGVEDLAGRQVCTVERSTPAERLEDEYPRIKRQLRVSYGVCVDELLAGTVDAVTTDDVILAGYRAAHPDRLRLLGAPFAIEYYGVGLHKGEPALKAAVCEAIREQIDSGAWKRSYDRHLKPLAPAELSDSRPPELGECPRP